MLFRKKVGKVIVMGQILLLTVKKLRNPGKVARIQLQISSRAGNIIMKMKGKFWNAHLPVKLSGEQRIVDKMNLLNLLLLFPKGKLAKIKLFPLCMKFRIIQPFINL